MLRRSLRKRVSTRMVSVVWFLNVYVVCVLFLFYVFRLFMSIFICVYMIVYACAGALRTSLPLELIDNFFSYSLSGPVHSNRFSNENGAVLLRFQKRFESTLIVFVRLIILQRQSRQKPHGMVSSVRHFGYSRWGGLGNGRVYFDDVTIFSVHTRKHRFQKASFLRACSHGGGDPR